jgi:hypothetical protein
MKRSALVLLAVGALAVAAVAGPKSGLDKGQSVSAFDVVDVSGPNRGKQLCYRCQYGNAPVVAAFIKGGASEAGDLVSGLQALVGRHKGKNLRSFVVFMGGPELKAPIEKMAAEKKVAVPLTFLPQGPSADDIKAYKINPEASSTVMLWNKGLVQASFSNVNKASWGEVSKAASDMLK